VQNKRKQETLPVSFLSQNGNKRQAGSPADGTSQLFKNYTWAAASSPHGQLINTA